MKIFPFYFIFTLTIVCSCRQSELGYAIINPNLEQYEKDSTYVSFDLLHPSELCPNPIRITNAGDYLSIQNTLNDGLSGIEITITLNPQMKIVDVKYDRWNDMIMPYEEKYKIEKIIFEVDKNPFLDSLITGRYSLEIIESISYKKELKNKGVNDTSFHSTFKGKFRVYRDDDIRANMTLDSIKK